MQRTLGTVGLAWILVLFCGQFSAVAQVAPHQAEQIRRVAPETARVPAHRPRTVLIWNTPPAFMDQDPHKGYCIPFGELAIKTLGEKTGAFRPIVSDDLASYLPENLQRFDAIVMNNSSGPWIRPTELDQVRLADKIPPGESLEKILRRSLLDYVRNGRGIVAYHYAIGANRDWPEFHRMLGGTFLGHPWNEEVGIRVEEPGHPLLAAFSEGDFRLTDEIYEFGDPYARSQLRVLLSLDTQRTNMNVPWIHRKDNDFAQAWVKTYGQGRIFYAGFGHRTEIWWNPALLQFYLDAIQFACGDLAAPTEPRPVP